MLEKWKHLSDHGYHIGVLCMDLSKAFGVINHSLLLAKLDVEEISLKPTTFIQSYLNKRMQKVNVSNKCSTWVIYSGMSQGSILGPFLFNVFTSDISDIFFITTCDMCHCADVDTQYAYSKAFH